MSQFTLPAQQLSTPEGVKSFAFALRDTLNTKQQDYRTLGNIKCLHAVSEGLGFNNWNQLEGMLSQAGNAGIEDSERGPYHSAFIERALEALDQDDELILFSVSVGLFDMDNDPTTPMEEFVVLVACENERDAYHAAEEIVAATVPVIGSVFPRVIGGPEREEADDYREQPVSTRASVQHFDGMKVVKNTAEGLLQQLKDYLAYQLVDESIDENPQLRHALQSAYDLQKVINGIESEDLRANMPHCKACGTSLMEPEAVMRQYLPKDEGFDPIFSGGHYDLDGEFQVDAFDGFGGARYDLHDDSDFCAHCNASTLTSEVNNEL